MKLTVKSLAVTYVWLSLVALVLAACSLDNSGPRVHIRTNGKTTTTYDLDASGQIIRSASLDRLGNTVIRTYALDRQRRLGTVSQETAAASTGTVTRFDYPGPGLNTSGTLPPAWTKTQTLPDGSRNLLKVEYFADDQGRLDGMMQTDQYGNVQAKSASD